MELNAFLDWVVNLVDSFMFTYVLVFGALFAVVGLMYLKEKLDHSQLTPLILNVTMVLAIPYVAEAIFGSGKLSALLGADPGSLYLFTSMLYWMRVASPFMVLFMCAAYGYEIIFGKRS